MQTLNNINFNTLELNCVLPEEQHNNLWNTVYLMCCQGDKPSTIKSVAIVAFELGASLAHQQEKAKVCKLLQKI